MTSKQLQASTNGIETDLHPLQGFVHAAYVIMTAQQVGVTDDFEGIRSAIFEHISSVFDSENLLGPGVLLLNEYFQNICKDDNPELDKFQIFFKFDVFFSKTFGLNYKRESMSFEYDYIINLSTEELVHLKYLIDRIQILMALGFYQNDFTLAFKRLERCQPNNFISGVSEFDYSKINSVRVRYLLAIYKSASYWRSVNNPKDQHFLEGYDNFHMKIYAWFYQKLELISKVLRPCHKSIDDSRFFASLYLPSSGIVYGNRKIVRYFRIYYTINQPGYSKKLNPAEYQKRFFRFLEKDGYQWIIIGKYMEWTYCKRYEDYTFSLRIRKVFLDFLLSYSFKVDKRGRAVSTKEFLFLKYLETYSVNHSSYIPTLKATNNKYFETLQVRSFGEQKSDFKAFKDTWRSFMKDYQTKYAKHSPNTSVFLHNFIPQINKYRSPNPEIMFPSPRLMNLLLSLDGYSDEFTSLREHLINKRWVANYMAQTYAWIKCLEALAK